MPSSSFEEIKRKKKQNWSSGKNLENADMDIVIGFRHHELERSANCMARRNRPPRSFAQRNPSTWKRLRVIKIQGLTHDHRLVSPELDKHEAEQRRGSGDGEEGCAGVERADEAEGEPAEEGPGA